MLHQLNDVDVSFINSGTVDGIPIWVCMQVN